MLYSLELHDSVASQCPRLAGLSGPQLYDLLCLAILVGVSWALISFHTGTLYFWLKDLTNEFLKLQVIFTALEIADKVWPMACVQRRGCCLECAAKLHAHCTCSIIQIGNRRCAILGWMHLKPYWARAVQLWRGLHIGALGQPWLQMW